MSARPPVRRLCLYTKTWRASGSGLVAQLLARALAERGVEVLHVAPRSDDPAFETPRADLIRWRPPRELPMSAPKLARALASGARVAMALAMVLAARLRARSFLITIPDPLVAALPALAVLRLTGARLTYVVHDPIPHAWRTPPALRWVERLGFACAYGLSDQLVALSPQSAEVLRRVWGARRKPIAMIEHGEFALAEGAPPPRREAQDAQDVVLMFGTLRANKGVREAIEGVLLARSLGVAVHLLIAGEPHGPERSYWAECRARAQAHPDAVTIREGYVANADLPGLLAQTSAFLLPYRDFDSQSGVAVLAASNARPILATRRGGLAALLDEGAPGVAIAEPADAAAIAEALGRFVARDRDTMDADCARYREAFLARRGWSKIAAAYEALVFAPSHADVETSPATG